MPESWMLARLNRETHRQQITADADRLSLLMTPVTVESYGSFLRRVYGFEAPVEAALVMTPDLAQVVDVRGRVGLRLLRSDMTALGIVDPRLTPRCSTISAFRGVPEALGWMYVIDRNTLLNGQLQRHLQTQLPAQLEHAGSYLMSFERSATTRWRELGNALDRFAKSPAHAERIANAAKAAFRYQRFWYEDRLPSHIQVA
jgi:heme oxygenase